MTGLLCLIDSCGIMQVIFQRHGRYWIYKAKGVLWVRKDHVWFDMPACNKRASLVGIGNDESKPMRMSSEISISIGKRC